MDEEASIQFVSNGDHVDVEKGMRSDTGISSLKHSNSACQCDLGDETLLYMRTKSELGTNVDQTFTPFQWKVLLALGGFVLFGIIVIIVILAVGGDDDDNSGGGGRSGPVVAVPAML